jgi:hypothetical protein
MEYNFNPVCNCNGVVYFCTILFISFHQWLYSPLLGPDFFFSFVILFTQTVGLLGRVISPLQSCYIHTGKHKHRINALTVIHGLNGIRTHDPSVRESEDNLWLRPCGHRDRLPILLLVLYVNITKIETVTLQCSTLCSRHKVPDS